MIVVTRSRHRLPAPSVARELADQLLTSLMVGGFMAALVGVMIRMPF